MSREPAESAEGTERYWHLVILTLGALLLVAGPTKAAEEISNGDGLLEATLDLILLSSPGLVMLYVGRWLPTASIEPELYPRIVGWVFGGMAVMGIVL